MNKTLNKQVNRQGDRKVVRQNKTLRKVSFNGYSHTKKD